MSVLGVGLGAAAKGDVMELKLTPMLVVEVVAADAVVMLKKQ